MKKNDVIKFAGIALVIAIMATAVFNVLFVGKLSSNSGSGKSLLVAARTLKAGTVLQATDLRAIAWPAAELPKGTFSDPAQLVGSAVFDSIAEGEPMLESRLVTANGSAVNGVPAGMRAVSVHVTDSTGVLALLHSGHHVDVQVVYRKGQDVSVRTALENLLVLSVTPQAELSSQGANLPVVTLLADPSDADLLAAADAGARVRLTLRNPGDPNTRMRAPLTLDTVMRTSGKSSAPETPAVATTKAAASHP
jgi:Flp pilus assembly protein CpaB